MRAINCDKGVTRVRGTNSSYTYAKIKSLIYSYIHPYLLHMLPIVLVKYIACFRLSAHKLEIDVGSISLTVPTMSGGRDRRRKPFHVP